jgi:hypothetical protein
MSNEPDDRINEQGEDLDPWLAERVRQVAEDGLRGFDPDATVAKALAEREVHRRWQNSRVAAGILVATVALAGTFGGLVVAGIVDPSGPSMPGLAGETSSSISPSGAPSSIGTEHYTVPGWLSFDYPGNWSIITDRVSAPNREIVVTLGIGGWSDNCHPLPATSTAGGGFECGADIWTVPPEGVVVQVYTHFGIGAPPPEPIPAEAIPLPNGGSFIQRDSSGSADQWWLWPPNGSPTYYVEARYGADNVDGGRAQVTELVRSIELLWQT